MKKEEALELWQERLSGELSQQEASELKAYLEANPEVGKELEGLEQTWELFDEIKHPEPSAQMDARFEGMLTAYQINRPAQNPLDMFVTWLMRSWQVALTSLVIGLVVGWWMLPSRQQSDSISQLSEEIQSMKQMMMLTLIEQPKAQERIRAVNMTFDLPDADEKVIEALITTLNQDDNLNVRLASLESLIRYAERDKVRAALIASLKMQESPIMLVAIADALVLIQEKASIETMVELKEKAEDELVRDKLAESIQSLTSI